MIGWLSDLIHGRRHAKDGGFVFVFAVVLTHHPLLDQVPFATLHCNAPIPPHSSTLVLVNQILVSFFIPPLFPSLALSCVLLGELVCL